VRLLMFTDDSAGVTVHEETMIAASGNCRPSDRRPLDKIHLLSDWTSVSPGADHDADRSSIDDELPPDTFAAAVDLDSTPSAGEELPDAEPVTEDAIAGAKVLCSNRNRFSVGENLNFLTFLGRIATRSAGCHCRMTNCELLR